MRRTVEAGEFQRLGTQRDLAERHLSEIAEFEVRWNELGTPLSAAELVGARLVAGQREQAERPARTLVDDENPNYRALARRTLAPDHSARDAESGKPHDALALIDLVRSKIVESKARVRRDPRNPIAWADLARRYTGLGQFDQAERALQIARALAPDSRYLLRISSRFFVHIGEPEAAVRLLRSSARTTEDPWLLAALISAASLARRPLPGNRVARRIVDSGRFRPIESSDLVSELGTLELKAGGERRAKRLFVESLGTPTDNSLAQVEWASHKLTSLDFRVDSFDVPFSAEAKARSASQQGEWKEAFGESLLWLLDQPFDTEAATHASYVAAVGLENWEESRSIATIGLCANPLDATLSNNLAYACVEMGDLEAAVEPLRIASANLTERSERVAILATSGLLEFRRGNHDEGRIRYGKAIELARRLNEIDAEAMARSMLMREEVRVGDVDAAKKILSLLDKVASRVEDAGVARCVERARQLFGLADVEAAQPSSVVRPTI